MPRRARRALAQPNFTRAADSLRNTAVELERCGNLPVMDSGNRLLVMMQTLLDRFDILLDRFEILERRVSISNKNMSARIDNSIVVHAAIELVPLYSFITGDVLQNCPATLADLENVSSQVAADLLHHLNEAVPRGLKQRRTQLRVAFGIRMRTV
ncbi:hypothetical protein CDD81_6197 [Ophiocordyceps australis]|uniref:Uncharacterized protein n=1 Tax=Ophiocordyceps australis TaxID=1399860 RepID=A0A2C5XUW4_9HYPO|nr:hypothetical protein CDD81_6197 [Ophiocordyceps australis]